VALTVTSIGPDEGHSGGQTLVEIVGTDFRLPSAPAATGRTVQEPPPSVVVTVGGRAATRVAVVSATLIYCLTPKGDPGVAQDVVVQNVDDDGAVLATATLAAAFTFQRPDLTQESELTRVVRALIQELKRQVLENVHFSTHTDYDDATGDVLNMAFVSKLPALVLANVEVPEDRTQIQPALQEFDADTGRFITRRPPVVVDIVATLVGVHDNPIAMLNLMQVVRMFFKKNPWLELDRSASDSSLGTVRYELDWSFGGPVSVQRGGDASDTESFGGQIVVRGVLLEDMPGITTAKPTGIPARFPHEATTGYGWKTDDNAAAIQVTIEQKDVDD
jgi:IPT/TIG domain